MSDEPFYSRGENGNDPLTLHAEGAGVWGLPSDTDRSDGADVPTKPLLPGFTPFDYSAGILVGVPGQEADAIPGTLHPTIVAKMATDQPFKSYETIHESTHRRYDAPFTAQVKQSAAGFTVIQAPSPGLHFLKVIAAVITLDAAGTLQFVQGDESGLVRRGISGTISMGGAAAPPLILPPAPIETPWFFLSPEQALAIVTTTGLAQGLITCCYSPYDA